MDPIDKDRKDRLMSVAIIARINEKLDSEFYIVDPTIMKLDTNNYLIGPVFHSNEHDLRFLINVQLHQEHPIAIPIIPNQEVITIQLVAQDTDDNAILAPSATPQYPTDRVIWVTP